MADVTIESIAIEITAAVDNADSALERLTKSLETLKSVCESGLNGADKVAKSLQKIAAAAHSFDSVNSSNIQSVAKALQSFQSVGAAPDLTNFARSIQSISTAASSINGADMTTFAANMQGFAAAMQPLQNLSGMGDISRAINALKVLPKVADGLSRMNLGTFAQQMQQITTAIQPFVTQMQNLSSSFTNMPAPIQQSVASIANYNTATVNASQSTQRLGSALKLVKFTAMYFAIRKVVNILGKFITASNEYVENLNLFTVSMGDAADEALEFANKVNSVMGIDVSQWIKNQAVFKQMTSGFGMVEEKANLVSKNMTQLGYDISSYFNISVEDSMQKLQAGLSGELEPLRRLGYALDADTLQQVAHAHGIEMNINNMSQAQKAQLRYIAIMEQSKNAMGDLSRTIESPANQIRILEARIETLKRAIGDALMPIVSAALPYITAFFQILGEAARKLAEFLGFKLPKFDYSDTMIKQNENIASSFDEATKASKEFKGSLASIDQLNIIGQKSEKGAGTGNNFGADLDLTLPEYDFLGGLEEETSNAYNTLKDFLKKIAPIAEGIGATLLAAFAIDKIKSVVSTLKDAFNYLSKTNTGKFFSGIAGGIATFFNLKKSVKDLVTGQGGVGELVASLGLAAGAAGAFLLMGNPFGAIAVGIGAVVGGITGWIEGERELNAEIADNIMYADNDGISIGGLADGFENYFDKIVDGYDDILANSQAMEENRDKVKEAADEIENITDKYRLMGDEMSAEDAETIKSNIETIGDGISDNLGLATQGIVEALKNKFHDFAVQLGYDVDDMVGKFYLLENMGDTAVASLKQTADEIVNQIQSGGLSEEEMKQKLSELDEVVVKMSGETNATAESVGFERALQEMDLSKVNFSNEDEVKSVVDDFGAKAKAASDKINEAWNQQIVDLQNLKQQYVNLGVNVEFDARMGEGSFDALFDNAQTVLNEGYKSELSKITAGTGVFLAAVQNQLDENIQKGFLEGSGVDFGDVFKALGESGVLVPAEDVSEKAIGYAYNRIKDQFSGIQSAIDDAANGIDISEFTDVSKYLLEGMQKGLIENQDDFNTALDAVANGGLDALRKAFKINSPSKETEEIGEYLMQGLGIGITKNMQYPLNAIDEVTKEISKRMSRISLNIPVYTEEDVNKAANGAWHGAWVGGMQSASQPVKSSGANPEAVSDVVRMWNSNGQPMDINVNLQSYVELDGEQLGAAVGRYQQQQMAYSNGY